MKTLHRPIWFIIATGVTSALLLGCGSSSSSGSESTDAPSDATSQITIEGSSFSVTGNVSNSDVLNVTNRDSFTHTVTADDGTFNVEVNGGETESLPALAPGVYSFHCEIHTAMQGTLTIV